MKRKRFTVDGDVLDRHASDSGPRYMEMTSGESGTLTESFFSFLPIEVTCLIVKTVAQDNSAVDLQRLLWYLLPLYGISPLLHQSSYNVTQMLLLRETLVAVNDEFPDLFDSCFEERMNRVSATTQSRMTREDRLTSLKALINAPFIELFVFLKCRLCEHCRDDLARTRAWERVNLPRVEEDDDLVPLCSSCDEYILIDKCMEESTEKLDFAELQRVPIMQYRWISEEKCLLWCGGVINPAIREKMHALKGVPVTLYLLKDALPFIKECYFINHKKGEPLTFSGHNDDEDGTT